MASTLCPAAGQPEPSSKSKVGIPKTARLGPDANFFFFRCEFWEACNIFKGLATRLRASGFGVGAWPGEVVVSGP